MTRLESLLHETVAGLRRNGLVAFAAISTTFIALLLFGLALLISRQVSLVIERTTGDIDIAVYLSDPVKPETVRALTETLTSLPVVESVRFETKEEACARFKDLFAGQQALVNTVNCDALPASLRVKLSEPERFALVAAALGCRERAAGGGDELICGTPGIDKVIDNRSFLSRLFAVTRVFRVGVLIVSLVMLVSAATLIANTVRMALFARRKEIGIMKLVGATNWRIRLPFVLESVFESLLGTILAVLVLFGLKVAFVNPLYRTIRFVPWITNGDVLGVVPWLLIVGIVVAVVAAFAGMRRFLEV